MRGATVALLFDRRYTALPEPRQGRHPPPEPGLHRARAGHIICALTVADAFQKGRRKTVQLKYALQDRRCILAAKTKSAGIATLLIRGTRRDQPRAKGRSPQLINATGMRKGMTGRDVWPFAVTCSRADFRPTCNGTSARQGRAKGWPLIPMAPAVSSSVQLPGFAPLARRPRRGIHVLTRISPRTVHVYV